MAQQKTHSASQRSALARSVILPKLLFVARHHWPDKATVALLDQHIRNYVWSGLFAPSTRPGSRGVRWMTQPLASLGKGSGGLAVPDLTIELHTLSATVVATWAYKPFGLATATCRLHGRDDAMIQPALWLATPPNPPALQATIWDDGRAGLRWAYGSRMPLPTQLFIQDAIRATQLRPRRWRRECIIRDDSDFHAIAGQTILQERERQDGQFHLDWLPHLQIGDDGSALVHAHGGTVKRSHLSSLGAGSSLRDFIEWNWVSFGVLSFRPPVFPMSNAAADCFLLLCDTIVANFPGILLRPPSQGHLLVLNIPRTLDVEWSLTDTGHINKYAHGFNVRTVAVSTQRDLQRQAPVKIDSKLVRPVFACVPALTRLITPWTTAKPWLPHRRYLKRKLGAHLKAAGLRARSHRALKWKAQDEDIGKLIDSEGWYQYLTAAGLTTYERQLWHRLRLHQLHVWPCQDDGRLCAYDECSLSLIRGTAHTMWTCVGASKLWRSVARLWGASDINETDLAHAVFTRTPPTTRHDWRELTSDGVTAGDRLHHWLDTLWRLLTTSTLRRLWASAVAHAQGGTPAALNDDFFAATTYWTRSVRAAITAISSQHEDTQDQDRKILTTLYKVLVVRSTTIPRFSGLSTCYVLFFDGGSRGNPGPGGSGSIIVGLFPDPQVTWVASMAYSDETTTNNYAEYRGLCTGLAAAAENRWYPLSVVGDSKMIIQQLSLRRRPKASSLVPWYEEARATADSIRVLGWHHHYRTHNKMADKVANQAMDTGTSYQALTTYRRPEMTEIREWLANDINHWLGTSLDPELQHDTAYTAEIDS